VHVDLATHLRHIFLLLISILFQISVRDFRNCCRYVRQRWWQGASFHPSGCDFQTTRSKEPCDIFGAA